MINKHYDIFISYRHNDGRELARTIKESLVRKGYDVFFDYDAIQDGVFDQRILNAIDHTTIYIILLTEHCLDRCSNEGDWVRLELEHAIAHCKHIIPLNPDHQFKGFPDDLPDFIRQGLRRHQYSAIDTGQLYLASIDQLDEQRLRPALRHRRWKIMGASLITIFVAAIILCGSLLYRQHALPNRYYQQALSCASLTSDSAMHYLSQAAELGHSTSQRLLADAYLYRTDLSSNRDYAFYWYQKAYLSGDTLAISYLGRCYQNGIGIPVDMAEAISLYREGVDLNSPFALYCLGQCMRDGVGIDKDVVTGWMRISDAAVLGCQEAQVEYNRYDRWIFTPSCDSTTAHTTVLRAICLSDSCTTAYFRWTNRQFVGGWMSIDPKAYIEDAESGTKYQVQSLIDCRFAPDTTSVPWGMSHDFAMVFPALDSVVSSINLCESDSSSWRWFGINID